MCDGGFVLEDESFVSSQIRKEYTEIHKTTGGFCRMRWTNSLLSIQYVNVVCMEISLAVLRHLAGSRQKNCRMPILIVRTTNIPY
jgi:hypothetical protein